MNNENDGQAIKLTGLHLILGADEPDQPGATRVIKVFTWDGDATDRLEDVNMRGGGLWYPCERFSEYMKLYGDTDGFVPAGDWLDPENIRAYRIEPSTEIRMCLAF